MLAALKRRLRPGAAVLIPRFAGLALDLRALAAFRIAVAALLLVDLYARFADVEVFYTDGGVLSRAQHVQAYYGVSALSVYLANGSSAFVMALFGLASVAAVSLLIGYRTRIAHVLSWLLLLSLHRRNPMVLQGGDILLRLLLLWSLFLPLGARWSVDGRIRASEPGALTPASGMYQTMSARARSVFGVGGLALLVQLITVYAYSLVLKSGDPWRDGTAVHYALHIDHFARPFAVWLRQYPDITSLLTVAVLFAEAAGPLLLLCTVCFRRAAGWLRMIAVTVMVGLHFGFGMGLSLGLFPWISCAAWMVWLPPSFWDRCERWWSEILGSSVFQRLKRYWGRLCHASAAAARLAPFMNMSVRRIAESRTHDSPRRLAHRPTSVIGVIAGVALLGYAVIWNNYSVRTPPSMELEGERLTLVVPDRMRWLGELLGLDQQWDMFAPQPFTHDGWYVVAGQTKSGEVVSLWPGDNALRLDKPMSVAARYPSQRWRKYWMNLWYPQNQPHRKRVLDYLCKDAKRRGTTLETAYMLYWEEMTPAPNVDAQPVGCHVLRMQRCDGSALAPGTPLPESLAKCDSYGWSDAIQKAVLRICGCNASDRLCKSRRWHMFADTVQRYVRQTQRGTAYVLPEAIYNAAMESLEQLESCLDGVAYSRLH